MADQRDLLSQLMMLQGGPQHGAPQVPPPSWAPSQTAPFGGLDQNSWKNPQAPVAPTGTADPTGLNQPDIDLMRSVYNSLRATNDLTPTLSASPPPITPIPNNAGPYPRPPMSRGGRY